MQDDVPAPDAHYEAPVLIPLSRLDGEPTASWVLFSVVGAKVQVAERTGPAPEPALYIGTLDGRDCWATARTGPEGDGYMDLMRLYGQVDEATWAAAGRAVQLVDWDRDHRFCGRCATPTEAAAGERARRCPECGLAAFPRLAPAVIVLVERDDGRALLARNAQWATLMYSCLAGFVEPGESAEAAARREVAEEVGVALGELRYFRSQPWPFPHSLMLGFHASYAGGPVRCDGTEITEAQWFAADDLPLVPGPMSIARALIDDWVSRHT